MSETFCRIWHHSIGQLSEMVPHDMHWRHWLTMDPPYCFQSSPLLKSADAKTLTETLHEIPEFVNKGDGD